LALKQPPRYDRACANLTIAQIEEKLLAKIPFIWRFKLDYSKTVSFYDLAHKTMHFELKHFSDVPLTRQDDSFTFLFANFVDDLEMHITHVFRGEDHLTNTAVQVAMYEAFEAEIPVFWHLPIMGNAEGKKLSKRDFGFSLTDLREAGYLPQAITNYLSIIGHSVPEEFMSLEKIIQTFNFDHLSSTGQIRYDLEKLRWLNHHWIMHYDTEALAKLCWPFMIAQYPAFEKMSLEELIPLLKRVQPELITLKESADALLFVIEQPTIDKSLISPILNQQTQKLLHGFVAALKTQSPLDALSSLQAQSKAEGVPVRDLFSLLRIALTGKAQGLGVKDLVSMLPVEEIQTRIEKIFAL
jgi:glutamyl/glutaminyl-tRNA synthetase